VPRNFSTVHLLHADQSLQSGTPEQVLSAANLTKAFRCTPGRHPLLMQESL